MFTGNITAATPSIFIAINIRVGIFDHIIVVMITPLRLLISIRQTYVTEKIIFLRHYLIFQNFDNPQLNNWSRSDLVTSKKYKQKYRAYNVTYSYWFSSLTKALLVFKIGHG